MAARVSRVRVRLRLSHGRGALCDYSGLGFGPDAFLANPLGLLTGRLMKKIKIAIIGAGSSYTPVLIEGLVNEKDKLPVDDRLG